MFDLLVKGGTVLDGTGAPARTADVAVREGIVVEVGRVDGAAARTIDADGALVTPGFVDIHTHYDGQSTWDERLAPSSWHGVTTVVMGNCGVGFAPVRPADHDRLIELMEGVEDIPGVALTEGLAWDWQGFDQFLDAVDARPHDIDVAAQVPHAALRLHVMGERGANREPATAEEIAEMGRLAAAGIRAGALGFTTSRTLNHKTSRGEPTPTLTAARAELVGIAAAIGATGAGVLQAVSDLADLDDEWTTFRAMVEASGRPFSLSLVQNPFRPEQYRDVLDLLSKANADGLAMKAQVPARAVGLLVGLQATVNPLLPSPTYKALAGLPLAEQVAALRTPSVREAVLAELADGRRVLRDLGMVYALGDDPDYEPDPTTSLAAVAARAGRGADEELYDRLLDQDGRALLYVPLLGYAGGDLSACAEMLEHPHTVPGLSDGGAHVGTICDASFPTTLLTHWARDRSRGPRIDLAHLVQRQTSGTAAAVGLLDRGVLAPGYRADVNVIDHDNLRLHAPELHFDLPAGGKRLLQRADGYLHTVVAGQETYAGGEATAALPGRLVRGGQVAPA